jgi:hypothetical protein
LSNPELWDEPLSTDILLSPLGPLSEAQLDTLWSMFRAIGAHWRLDVEVDLFRSRWLDMIEARSFGTPDYRAEYINAATVYEALIAKLGEGPANAKLYGETAITDVAQAATRLGHAKFYVANDFIRCFVATGGFRGFVPKARNYSGFMGGSRFREWAPVRTGRRK